MGHQIRTTAGESVELTFNNILNDGSISVTAYIYSGATEVTNVALSHVANGFYRTSYTVPSGYTKLVVYYVPSGTDNATSIDYIDIALTSGGGGSFAGVVSGGLDDKDLKNIENRLSPLIAKHIEEELKKLKFPKEIDYSRIEKIKNDISQNIETLKKDLNKIVIGNKQEIPKYDKQFSQIFTDISTVLQILQIFPTFSNDILEKIKMMNDCMANIKMPVMPDYQQNFLDLEDSIGKIKLTDIDLSGPLQISLSGDKPLIIQQSKQDNTQAIKEIVMEQGNTMFQNMKVEFEAMKNMPDQSLDRLRILGDMIQRFEISVKQELSNKVASLDKVEVERTKFLLEKLMGAFQKALQKISKLDDLEEMKSILDTIMQKVFA